MGEVYTHVLWLSVSVFFLVVLLLLLVLMIFVPLIEFVQW